jgi:diamine N-acetyltransferase
MLKGDKISLRPIGSGDIEWLRATRNKYRDSFYTRDEISPSQQRAWYDRYVECNTDLMFIIITKDGDKAGTIALYNIKMDDRSADVGRIIVLEEFRGEGYMEEALQLLTDHAFKRMRLFKLKISTYLDNAAAIGLYSKVGFESLQRPVMLLEMRNPDKDVFHTPLEM